MSTLRTASLLALALASLNLGCSGQDVGSDEGNITDVKHTKVERQAIGNCWLYAQASWVESMHLSATGEEFDTSQSYWTYWHWYDQILNGFSDEISTGGNSFTANDIVLDRGLISEPDFVAEDAASEMSSRQSSALSAVNSELKSGRLKDSDAKNDPATVRAVLDDAWELAPEVRAALDTAFGKDGSQTLRGGGTTEGTRIIPASAFDVAYTERESDPSMATDVLTTLDVAIDQWNVASYPSFGSGSSLDSKRRAFQIRIQKALHDRQPVVVTWDVDFNAMESGMNELRGSFNLTTLANAGRPGRQGGHMTVFEDYQAETEEFGLLAAGVTLDPSNPDDAAKLDAALEQSTKIQFFRIKNSWGALRDDRASAPGFPGYHDLYMDYLNGPITWCPDVNDTKTPENCKGKSNPLRSVILPPGY